MSEKPSAPLRMAQVSHSALAGVFPRRMHRPGRQCPTIPPLPPTASDLLARRREKAAALVAAGIAPFGGRFEVDGSVADVRAAFAEGKALRAAGRITAHRDMGKSHFLDLSDATGRIQIYVNAKGFAPEQMAAFGQLDLGDFLGIEGECFVTRTGECTIRATKFTPLGKALRPLPEKWHGLADVEQRYRQRYLDLVSNEESRRVLLARPKIVRAIRDFLETRGFVEVETPILQAIASGAAARPFTTHHNAYASDLHLRIALELNLKRLLVGGIPKVFEMGRNFRNEGVSRRHNPGVHDAGGLLGLRRLRDDGRPRRGDDLRTRPARERLAGDRAQATARAPSRSV